MKIGKAGSLVLNNEEKNQIIKELFQIGYADNKFKDIIDFTATEKDIIDNVYNFLGTKVFKTQNVEELKRLLKKAQKAIDAFENQDYIRAFSLLDSKIKEELIISEIKKGLIALLEKEKIDIANFYLQEKILKIIEDIKYNLNDDYYYQIIYDNYNGKTKDFMNKLCNYFKFDYEPISTLLLKLDEYEEMLKRVKNRYSGERTWSFRIKPITPYSSMECFDGLTAQEIFNNKDSLWDKYHDKSIQHLIDYINDNMSTNMLKTIGENDSWFLVYLDHYNFEDIQSLKTELKSGALKPGNTAYSSFGYKYSLELSEPGIEKEIKKIKKIVDYVESLQKNYINNFVEWVNLQ